MAVETIFQPTNYTVGLPFMAAGGGAGVDIAADSTGARYVIPDYATGSRAQAFQAYNDGLYTYWIFFGGSTVSPTTAGLPVPPNSLVAYTVPNDGTYTHFTVRTRAGLATTGTVNFGLGT